MRRLGWGGLALLMLLVVPTAAWSAEKPDMTHLWRLVKTSWGACYGNPTHFMTTSQSECNVAKSIGYEGNCSTGNYDAEHYVSSVSFPNSVTVSRLSKGGTCNCKDTFIYTPSSYWKNYFVGQGYSVESGKEYYAWDPTIGNLNTANDWGLVPVYHAYSSQYCDNFYSEHPNQYNSKLSSGYSSGFETNPTAVAYYAADGWLDLQVQCSQPGCSWKLTGPGGWSVNKSGNYTFPTHSLPSHGYRLQCNSISGMVTKNADQSLYFSFFTSNVAKCEYTCNNECSYSGQKQCYGDGYRTCQSNANGCLEWSNVYTCNDYDPCTSGDGCSNGSCVPGTPIDCSYLTDTCNTGMCAGGQCIAQPKGGACNDGDSCTSGDQCVNGTCAGTPMDCSYLSDVCKTGLCSGGQCIAQNKSGSCDDGDPCTLNDACANGTCQSGAPKDCSYLTDTCNTGLCANGTCIAQAKNGNCDDGDPCTIGDVCSNGTCLSGAPLNCDDLTNACYNGVCQGGVCQKVPKPGMECDDGIACTIDSCDVVQGCLHDPSVALCDDGNACTADDCLLAGGCINNPAPGACDDGNGCTVGDACVEGSCSPGTPKDCSDNNPCTDDSCVPATGDCSYLPNTAACDDDSDCTSDDVCADGECTGTPMNCNDDIKCTADICVDGVGCQSTPADEACDDGNPCTADTCSAVLGCQFESVSGACDNGDPCTVGDACQEGKCVAGTPKTCDDNNPCTADSCDPETGNCLQVPKDIPCDDGNDCTTNDSCITGECTGELLPGCCATVDDCPEPGQDCLSVACIGGQCKEAAFCLEGQCGISPCDDNLVCNNCLAIEVCVQGWCQEECGPEDKEMTRCTNDGKTLEKCVQDEASGFYYWKATDCVGIGEAGCAYSQDKGINVCCTPDCEAKSCGKPSACGISCGTCGDEEYCCLAGEPCADDSADNLFQCVDCCAGMECGLSTAGGCAEQCGTCPDGETCKSGACVSGCEDANVDAEGMCAGSVAWWCEEVMGQEVLKSLDCIEYVATCCFDESIGHVGCCDCESECDDKKWACGKNSCGQDCGDYEGECAPGFNCIPETHQCICQMPELCYPDVTVDTSGQGDKDVGGIVVPVEEDGGGGSKSGNCSAGGRPTSGALLLALLLLALVVATRSGGRFGQDVR